jgi:integrase
MTKDETRLSARTAATVGDGWHADGNHLYLRVDGQRRRWVVKVARNGQKREFGAGSVDTTSLAQARRKRDQILAMLADGRDPVEGKRQARAAREAAANRKTFAEVAEAVLTKSAAGWRSRATAKNWERSLRIYCKPIAATPIDQITTQDIVRVLSPLWGADKHEVAARLLPRISTVMAYATAHGWRSGDDPASIKIIRHLRPATPAGPRKRHAALDWRDMPAFMTKLRATPTMSALILEFAILTATRSAEARGCRWDELNLTAATWRMPAGRMKANVEHIVPLSRQALALLHKMTEAMTTCDLVFEGRQPGKPLRSSSVLRLMNKLAPGGETVHGFRSAARSFWADHGVDREIAEMNLSHKIGSAIEQAYYRTQLLERRRPTLQAWADWLDGATVLPFAKPAG